MSSEWNPNASEMYSNGAAYADFDNDGDLDIVVNNVDENALILKNNSDKLNTNYIELEFRGLQKNTKGIGVKVLIFHDDKKQYYENYSVRGYQSSVPPKIHAGLGESNKIDSLLVYWPNNRVQKFNDYRSEMNEKILSNDNKIIKRIFNLDTNAFKKGCLPVKTKELMGLVASAVLRCDDCIAYHLETCYKEGVSKEEIMETLSIATLIGGTIVIPHLRKAYEFWEVLEEKVD